MIDHANFDIQTIRRNASSLLGKFAVDTLKERKWITKSYTNTFPFVDDTSAKNSQSKLFKIIVREFLKIYPFIKQAVVGNFEIRFPEVSSTSARMYLTGMDENVMIRYLNILNNKIRLKGLPFALSLRTEVIYKGWNVVQGSTYVVDIVFNPFRVSTIIPNPNPYNLFLVLDDIIKVACSIAKYIVVIDIASNTVHALYLSQRDHLQKNREEIKAEEIRRETLKAAKKVKLGVATNTTVDYSVFNNTATTITVPFTGTTTAGF